MRQRIVRATNPQGRTVEVALLTDDRQRPAPQIICLMFNRWTQENDFKYLDQQAHTEKEVSRLEALIQQQMVRRDTRNKRLLDSLKLIARNAFYQALQPFKQAYNNYRDDHELFRNPTQADRLLAETAEHVDAYLLPTGNYPPKLDRIVQGLLAELNATHPLMPDDSGRPLRLHLGDQSDFQVAIVS